LNQIGRINIVEIQDESTGAVEVATMKLPDTNSDTFIRSKLRSKFITIRGAIEASSKDELFMLIEEMKNVLSNSQRNLTIWKDKNSDDAFTGKIYTATCVNLDQMFDREHWNISYTPFNITFQVTESRSRSS